MRCMITHRRRCRRKERPARKRQDNECTQSDGESSTWDLGWEEHECHSSHTGADGCYLLWTAILNMGLCETACCKDKGCKDGNVSLSNGWTAATLFCPCLLHSLGRNAAFCHTQETGSFFPSVSALPHLFWLTPQSASSRGDLTQCLRADCSQNCSQFGHFGPKQISASSKLTQIETSVQI